MIYLRSFARSASRTVSRIATVSAKPPRPLLQSNVLASLLWRQPAIAPLSSAFSTSARRWQSNEELIAKLQSEIDIEQSMRDSESYSNNIKEYLENSSFEVKDTPGHEEVLLTRQFGDEKITVTFTIADLANMDQDQDPDEYDDAFDDEQEVNDIVGQQPNKNMSKGPRNDGSINSITEDKGIPADREFDDEFDDDGQRETNFPARASIKIERPGRGAILVEAIAQDGEFAIDNVFYFPSADLAEPQTADKEWARRALYTGPQFGSLDEDLQLLLEKYLEERGINTRMALFIPDYIDYKEQKEYLRWLANVKNFVE